MDYFALSDTGKYRQNNEDSYFADDESCLFIVADGMGGHQAGEIASKTAVDNFSSYFINNLNKNNFRYSENDANDENKEINESIQKILIDSAAYANKKIYNLGLKNKHLAGMGTTLTSVFIFNNNAYVLHVGDSRLYLFRENNLNLLTEDHTLVFQLYKKGIISYEDTFSHPQRNYLTSVLGENEISNLECFKVQLYKGDIMLLCSDGLNSMIKDNAIKDIMNKFKDKTAQNIAEKFILHANKNGGKDNITAIIIKI